MGAQLKGGRGCGGAAHAAAASPTQSAARAADAVLHPCRPYLMPPRLLPCPACRWASLSTSEAPRLVQQKKSGGAEKCMGTGAGLHARVSLLQTPCHDCPPCRRTGNWEAHIWIQNPKARCADGSAAPGLHLQPSPPAAVGHQPGNDSTPPGPSFYCTQAKGFQRHLGRWVFCAAEAGTTGSMHPCKPQRSLSRRSPPAHPKTAVTAPFHACCSYQTAEIAARVYGERLALHQPPNAPVPVATSPCCACPPPE